MTAQQASSQTTQQYSRLYYGWVIVCVCMIVMTLAAPLLASFSIFYVAIINDLGWSRGDTALGLAIFLVLTGLSGPVAGALVDRFQPRRVMPVGTLMTAIALVWMSRMTTKWEFYVAYGLLAAAGASLIHLVPFTAIVSNWFMRHRGLAIGAVTAGQGVGQVSIPLIQYMIDHIGWRGSYLVIGGAFFVIPTALILLFLQSRPEDRNLSLADERLPWEKRPEDGDTKEQRRGDQIPADIGSTKELLVLDKSWAETDWTVIRAMKTVRLWMLVLLVTLFGAGFMMVNVQLVAYLEDKGYSSIMAASAVGLQGFLGIFGRFVGGGLSDRIGREKTVTLSAVIFILFLALLYLSGFGSNPWVVYAAVILFGLGGAMPLPALMAATGDIFQGKHLGAIIGVIMMGGFVGGAVGAWLGGKLFDLTHSYNSHFILTALVTLSTVALIWGARPGKVRALGLAPAKSTA